ncbi:hypothetical protein M0804_013559 [Polistes exclamans]|nr:hypothetical protein M0804_013559 [Polistes exclamans]
MEKEEYIKEMNKLLEDRNTYSILSKDPTNRFKQLANNLPKKLQNKSIISEEMGKNLISYNSVAPKLYGLRKTHKKECALRTVKKKLEQHKNDCKPTNAQKNSTTALADHHFKKGHKFKFDETAILEREDN